MNMVCVMAPIILRTGEKLVDFFLSTIIIITMIPK